MPQKIIIDADPGVGDAFAVLTALVDPSIEVIGLTATAGSVSGIQATRNLQFLVELADPVKHPRVGESRGPSAVIENRDKFDQTRHSFCGQDGLGNLDVNIPDLHNRRESAKLIVDLVNEFPHEVKVLSLGPLTNIAAAIEFDPGLPAILDSIVVLGGTDHSAGDVSAVAEFNIACDAEAAATVFKSLTSKTLVPLEISRSGVLTFDDVHALTELMVESDHGETLTSMLNFSLRAQHQLACEGIPLHSIAALAIAADAESFSEEPVRVAVETAGTLTRGMTVIDRRPRTGEKPNASIISRIDGNGVVDYFSRSLRRAAR